MEPMDQAQEPEASRLLPLGMLTAGPALLLVVGWPTLVGLPELDGYARCAMELPWRFGQGADVLTLLGLGLTYVGGRWALRTRRELLAGLD
jgi:hypothetical protein